MQLMVLLGTCSATDVAVMFCLSGQEAEWIRLLSVLSFGFKVSYISRDVLIHPDRTCFFQLSLMENPHGVALGKKKIGHLKKQTMNICLTSK